MDIRTKSEKWVLDNWETLTWEQQQDYKQSLHEELDRKLTGLEIIVKKYNSAGANAAPKVFNYNNTNQVISYNINPHWKE